MTKVEASMNVRFILGDEPKFAEWEGVESLRYIGATDDQVRWGGNADPRGVLTPGEAYDVERVVVHSWHTKVYLAGIEGAFNSVCFEPVK